MVRDGDDALIFSLPWSNVMEVRTGANQARVGPGEALITSLGQVGSLRTPAGVHGVSLRIGRQVARSLAPGRRRSC